MASFAKKVRKNQDLRSAARSLGMKPSQVSSRSDLKRVRQEARSRASARTASSSAGSAAAAAPQKTMIDSYAPTTVGGNYVSSGVNTITGLMGRFPGNETIAGMGAGTLFDIGRTQANTGMAIAYNDAFLGSLGNYQSGQENLRTANASKLIAQEGAIARDLTDLTTGRQLEGLKYGADRSLEGTRYVADLGLQGTRYVADRGLEGERYVADRGLEGTRYVADRGLEGTKYGYDSQERQIGIQGREDRLTAERKTIEEKRLRADARGAIRSQGARFYG